MFYDDDDKDEYLYQKYITITTMISTSEIDRLITSQSLERAVRLILEENSCQFNGKKRSSYTWDSDGNKGRCLFYKYLDDELRNSTSILDAGTHFKPSETFLYTQFHQG